MNILLLKKIESSIIYEKPFSYIVIDNFLPKKYYKTYLENIPDIKEYDIFESNTRYYLSKEKYNKIKIMKEINDFFTEEKTFSIICEKFSKSMKKHLNKKYNFQLKNFVSYSSLQKMNSNYGINIHTDGGYQPFSILYYADKTNNNLTLNLYELKKEPIEEYKRFVTKDEVILKKEIKTSGNKIIIFLDSPIAYHSITNTNTNTNKIERNMHNIAYYLNKNWIEGKDIFWKKQRTENNKEIKNFVKFSKVI